MEYNKRVLILYAEVMDYLLASLNKFKVDNPKTEIYLFELDKKKKTNFKFDASSFKYFKKSDFNEYKNFKNKCLEINPDVILVSGRMDQHYLKISRFFKNKDKYTVTLQDTQFEQSIRQGIIRFFAYNLYLRNFSGFWGAGKPQYAFGRSLGFQKEDLFSGVYAANDLVFKSDFSNKIVNKKESKNKNFLFVGRLEPEKNILMLIEAIKMINKMDNVSHKIIIYGDGSLKSALMNYDFVELNPFSNSEELAAQRNRIDFFCLPSKYEPWGVVVHEFAHLGLPLLLSKEVGAATEYLIEGYNGFSFNPKSFKGLVEIIRMASCLNGTDIDLMGKRSSVLAKRISTEHWSNTLKSIIIRSTLK